MNPFVRLRFCCAERPSFLSLIVPVSLDIDGLCKLFALLETQSLPRFEFEIIVGNDGADPGIAEICKNAGVKYVDINPRRGSYFARNRALELACGEFVALADADVLPSANWLQNGRQALTKADYVAGAVRIDATQVATMTHYYELKCAFPVEQYFNQHHFGPTANLFVRRAVFEEIGGFDERIVSGGDAEFGDRVFRAGKYRCVVNKNVEVMHPPRACNELMRKIDRVACGRRHISLIYPQRYPYFKLSRLLLGICLPVRLSYWRAIFGGSKYNLLQSYLFCWWLKIWRYYCQIKWRLKLS